MSVVYDVVTASVLHVKPLASMLRPAVCASLRDIGLDPRSALRHAVRASRYARTALIAGEPVAMWGAQGTLLSDAATVWAVFGNPSLRFPLAIVRRAREELTAMSHELSGLYATIARSDERAVVFARTLGFKDTESSGTDVALMVFGGKG